MEAWGEALAMERALVRTAVSYEGERRDHALECAELRRQVECLSPEDSSHGPLCTALSSPQDPIRALRLLLLLRLRLASSSAHTRACTRLQHRHPHPVPTRHLSPFPARHPVPTRHPFPTRHPVLAAAQLRELERQSLRVELDAAKRRGDGLERENAHLREAARQARASSARAHVSPVPSALLY